MIEFGIYFFGWLFILVEKAFFLGPS